MTAYQVVEYSRNGTFRGIISGCGKNRGTWDSDHSRSSAYRIARELRLRCPESVFKVEVAS